MTGFRDAFRVEERRRIARVLKGERWENSPLAAAEADTTPFKRAAARCGDDVCEDDLLPKDY